MKMIKLHVIGINRYMDDVDEFEFVMLKEPDEIALKVDDMCSLYRTEYNVVTERHMDDDWNNASWFYKLFIDSPKQHIVRKYESVKMTCIRTIHNGEYYVSEDIDEIFSVLNR